jgi:hypothetical protein
MYLQFSHSEDFVELHKIPWKTMPRQAILYLGHVGNKARARAYTCLKRGCGSFGKVISS